MIDPDLLRLVRVHEAAALRYAAAIDALSAFIGEDDARQVALIRDAEHRFADVRSLMRQVLESFAEAALQPVDLESQRTAESARQSREFPRWRV